MAMGRRYNGRQKGVKGQRQNIEVLKGEKLKCAIQTINDDWEGLKGHEEALKIDRVALKDDGVLNSNSGAIRAKKRH